MITPPTPRSPSAARRGGVPRATNEVGTFNNIISSANAAALTLGANVAVGGLIFSNNLNGGLTGGAGKTLTLGGAGIDTQGGDQNVRFNKPPNPQPPHVLKQRDAGQQNP